MKLQQITLTTLLSLAIVTPTQLVAQQHEGEDPYFKFRITGEEHSERIPTWVKMDKFMVQYRPELLYSELSKRDREFMFRAAEEIAWIKGANTALALVRKRNTACPMLKRGESAFDIATHLESVQSVKDALLEEAYSTLIGRLSPDGSAAVVEYLERQIVPTLVYKQVDTARIAELDEEGYLGSLREFCDSPIKGEIVVRRSRSKSGGFLESRTIR